MRSKEIAVFSVLLPFLVILFAFITGQFKGALLAGDLFFLFHPINHLITETAQSGSIPLWNPYSHCGSPLIGSLRDGFYYPLTVLFRLFDVISANRIFLLLHTFLAGLFSYLLARSCRFGRVSSLLLAAGAAFNGFFFLHGAYYNQVAGIVWLPVLFLFLRKSSIPLVPRAVLLGMTLTLQFLSGNPFFAYASLLLLFLFDLEPFAWRTKVRDGSPSRLAMKWTIVSVVLAGLSAVQIIPFYEVTGLSVRASGLPFEMATVFSEPLSQIAKFLLMPLWSWFDSDTAGDPTIVGFYLGITVLGLSVKGLLSANRRARIFWGACLAGSLVLSLGSNLPGYEVLWSYFPGIKFVRFPAQWLYISAFSLCVLSAIGLGSIRNANLRICLLSVVLAELFLFAARNPFGIANAGLFRASHPAIERLKEDRPGERISHAELNFGLGDRQLKTGEDWLYAQRVFLPNLSVPHHIHSAAGYGLTPPIWKVRLFSFLSGLPGGQDLWHRISASGIEMVYREAGSRVALSQIERDALPRAGFFSGARFFDSDESLMREIAGGGFHPGREVLVTDEGFDGRKGPSVNVRPLRHEYGSPNELTVEIPPESGDGWLYVADNFYTGWEAYVDGEKTRIRRANISFRAVRINDGAREVRFLYRPRSFFGGLLLSVLALAAITAPTVRRLRNRFSPTSARPL